MQTDKILSGEVFSINRCSKVGQFKQNGTHPESEVCLQFTQADLSNKRTMSHFTPTRHHDVWLYVYVCYCTKMPGPFLVLRKQIH